MSTARDNNIATSPRNKTRALCCQREISSTARRIDHLIDGWSGSQRKPDGIACCGNNSRRSSQPDDVLQNISPAQIPISRKGVGGGGRSPSTSVPSQNIISAWC